jgi:hypothetical protein
LSREGDGTRQGHAGSTLRGVVVRVIRSQMRLAIGPVIQRQEMRPKDELYPSPRREDARKRDEGYEEGVLAMRTTEICRSAYQFQWERHRDEFNPAVMYTGRSQSRGYVAQRGLGADREPYS